MKLEIPDERRDSLFKGVVIPALPLALNRNRILDERRQRALIRYYLDAGAGGVAVGVHTTQFAIRLQAYDLYRPVLEIAKEEFDRFTTSANKPVIRIAGIIGKTNQAIQEAKLAINFKYDAALLGLTEFGNSSNEEILDHCKTIANIIPVIGFYLQQAVGGRRLNIDFWREFSKIENVIAIKIAPFNRYQTLDVVRAVAESGRADQIALYTGNDDNIVIDLLTKYQIKVNNNIISRRIVGGILGHWAVWTQNAVNLLEKIHHSERKDDIEPWLSLAANITDCNAAFFDAANNFAGCIPGLHEVLRRQGLLEGIWTLDPDETLSPGQMDEIDRVYASYPELNDDIFVNENLHRWLA